MGREPDHRGEVFRAMSPVVDDRAVAYRLDGTATLVDGSGRELPSQGLRFRWILPLDDGRAPACTVDWVHGALDRDGRFTAAEQDPESRARVELARYSNLLYERGYNASIDGNLSYRLDEATILMTPTGSHLGYVRPEDFVVTDLEGRLVRGAVQPTSEFRLHVELHRRRRDCRCIIHVHAPYALAASVAGLDLHETYISVAPIPTTEYARIASPETPAVLAPFMDRYNWAIIPRHGIVTWADTPWNAFLRVEGLEHCAKVLMTARACGPIQPLPPDKSAELLRFWGLTDLVRSR